MILGGLSSLCAPKQKISITLTDSGLAVINRNIYGQFLEHLGRSIYEGIYRNGQIRQEIAAVLKHIRVPNLRWPGDCFADQYHWQDGIGSTAARPKRVNTTWGMVTEDNSFGTSEFTELCKQIGCKPYITGNVGTGTTQESKDWKQHLNFGGKSSLVTLHSTNGHKEAHGVSRLEVGNGSWRYYSYNRSQCTL